MPAIVYEGGCLCGAVRYRAVGEPKWAAFCHCRSCRRATGAPVTAYAGFERDHFRFEGQPAARFASSPGVTRSFCTTCGTPLTFESLRWPTEVHVHLGSLDEPERLEPTRHAFQDEHIPWLRLPGLE